jgi:hypothetical protein
METVRIDVEGVQETLNILRKFQPESLAQLRRDIKNDSGLNAAVSSVKAEIPPVAPLSGMMNHNGRTQYRIPRVAPSLKSPKRTMSSQESSLITIATTSPKDGIGFEIIDMAGRGSGGRTPRGRAMIANLAKKASRFVYPGFEKKQEGIEKGVLRILEDYAAKVNVKLRVM